jgi:serine/threonine protein kinase
MESRLTNELQKLRKMLVSGSTKPDPPSRPLSPVSFETNCSSSNPDDFFLSRPLTDCRSPVVPSSPGVATPQYPSQQIRPFIITPPTVRKKYDYDSSDSDDLFAPSQHSSSRYACDYTEIKEIGSGSFGRVYKCRKNLEKLEYAVKKIKLRGKSEHCNYRAIQEALTLAHSSYLDDNSYIVKYYTAWIEKNFLYLIMELCDCSLPEYIERKGQMDEKRLYQVFREVCKGLKKLHKHNIVHLDIKPDNILFSFNHKFKIGDLGLARITTNMSGDIPEGDSRYLAPELMNALSDGQVPDLTKADIFSLGCTILELMNNKPLPNNGPEWHDIRNGKVEISGQFPRKIKETVRKMLDKDPEKRPTAGEILKNILPGKNKRIIRQQEKEIKWMKFQLKQMEDSDGMPIKRRKLSI